MKKVCALLFAVSCFSRPVMPVDVQSVLVHKTMWLCGDEAVLVTDPVSVREMADLVLNNRKAGLHACGYHWLIHFIASDGSISTVPHNVECEEYERLDVKVHEVLNRRFQEAATSPKSFLVALTIRASTDPHDVPPALTDWGQVFFIAGLEQRLPRLTLCARSARPIPDDRGQWDAAETANRAAALDLLSQAVALILAQFPGATQGDISYPASSFGGGTIEDDVARTLYLPIGSSFTNLPKLPTGISVTTHVPSDYHAELVTSTRLDDNALAALVARHSFLVEAVSFAKPCTP